jgi:actin-related protein
MSFSPHDDIPKIILDNGSGTIKAGFAGEETPDAFFPNIIGDLRHASTSSETNQKQSFIGNKALANKDILTIRYPIEHGIVTNWDDMEKIWHHLFYQELHILPEERPFLLTEAPFTPIGNREKMTEILFEHFHVPGNKLLFSQILLNLFSFFITSDVYSESRYSCVL